MTATRAVPRPARPTHAPLVVGVEEGIAAALDRLVLAGQGVACVAHGPRLVGIVTAEDLGFAAEWAKPAGSVADAMTLGLVEVGRGSDLQAATDAYCEGLRRWVAARRGGC